VTRPRAAQPMDHVSVSGKGKGVYSSPKRPDRLWDPAWGTRVLSPGLKWSGREPDHEGDGECIKHFD
jgi:hypothetical protein